MTEGTFQASGREYPPQWLAGLLFLAFVPMTVLSLGFEFGSVSLNTFFNYLPVAGVFFFVFLAGLLALSLKYPGGIDEYEVTVDDYRDSGGNLRISYNRIGKGIYRHSLVVKKVKAQPKRPLMRAIFKSEIPVEGTTASLYMIFATRPSYSITFGFRDEDEMNKVYSLVKEWRTVVPSN